MAKQYQCPVTCLNLSEAQNDVNRRLSKEAGLGKQITVEEGNFESVPYKDDAFDLVWSQDSILHSGQKKKVLEEAFRVLRPGGTMVFSDPMQDEKCPTEQLQPILARIHLESLASPQFYKSLAEEVGFQQVEYHDFTEHLTFHYDRVRTVLKERTASNDLSCSQEYVDRMIKGLGHWVDAGKDHLLRWGIFVMRKPTV